MKSISAACWLCLFAALFYSFAATAQTQKSPGNELVFVSANVIPMHLDTVLANQTVVVRNGQIAYIGTDAKKQFSNTAKIIDAKGKYLIPGLAEMHAHVPPVDDLEPMEEVLLLFVANGVTTIRGMLGHPKHLELKKRIQQGATLGPHFFTSGPSANGNSVPTPEAAVQLVKDQKKAGYDFIKIHPGIKLAAFDALAQAAKKENLPFAGHVPSDVGIWNALDKGILTIDHLDGMVEALISGKERFAEGAHGLFASTVFMEADTSRISRLMQALLQHKVWMVPTQALAVRWLSPVKSAAERSLEAEMKYMDKTTIENWIRAKNNMEGSSGFKKEDMPYYIALRNQLIRACHKSGIPLLLGSDAPQVFNVPGFSVHHELQYLVDAGLTPYEALYSGTVQVGKFYGDEKKGTMQKGAPADIVLLSANPLSDIANTQKIEGVVLRGQWLDQQWRAETLQKIADKKRGVQQ